MSTSAPSSIAVSISCLESECRGFTRTISSALPSKPLILAISSTEWALISGVNDTEEVARKLASRLKGLMCHVNAIPLNPTTGYQGRATNRQSAAKFKGTLEQAGIPCTIRMRRGIDIQAGCGQLAGNFDG